MKQALHTSLYTFGVAILALAFLNRADAGEPTSVHWRTDYNTARAEAEKKGLPVLLVVGSENCVYCRKQDFTTFNDPVVVTLINENFVPVKIDGSREHAFAQALKVQVFPTSVLAGPDGKIVDFLQGYVSPEQMRDHAKRTLATVKTPEWVNRDLEESTKAIAAGEYPRAITLLKNIESKTPESPARTKSQQALADVERLAADKLAQAKKLEESGQSSSAGLALADIVKTFAGTQAAQDATTRLTEAMKANDRLRSSIVRELTASARDDFRGKRYADCFDKCDQIAAAYGDLPEAKESVELLARLLGDDDLLSAANTQANERAAKLQLALAESLLKKGKTQEASACWERVLQMQPNSRFADQAQVRLASIRKGGVPAITVGLEKTK